VSARDDAPAPGSVALAVLLAGYVALFGGAAWFKYDAFLMGFDLAVHEQVLWNTAHGRIAATSAFAATESYLGIDLIPSELLLAPLYAVLPGVPTMLFLKTLVVALGAVAVERLVRQHGGDHWSGVAFAALYLLYLPVQYTNLYEFQIRAFATTLLLWALWALGRRDARLFWVCIALALGCRSDVGLVVAGIGAWQLSGRWWGADRAMPQRDRLAFGWLPVIIGLGWLVLAVGVLVPWFRGGAPFLYTRVIYGWLGDTPLAMLQTLVTRPAYVLGVVGSADRLWYLFEMFVPFAFLAFGQPRLLLITAPIFALNLLSSSPNIHASPRYHYQAVIVPFLVLAAALTWLALARRWPAWRTRSLVLLLALAIGCNLAGRNPVLALAIRDDRDPAREATVARLIALVPEDAALATTSTIGPHVARREALYFFPGNIIYPAGKLALAEYLLVDAREARPAGHAWLVAAQRDGQITLLAAADGVSLWRRSDP
jgi:uncharacterized membrane protein